MKVLISGASGLLGSAISARLNAAGHQVTETSRSGAGGANGAVIWRVQNEPAPVSALIDKDAVIHLAGESIASGRWTAERKARIRDSRVLGTRNLVEGMRNAKNRPSVLICASAVGFYGDRGDESLTEDSPPGKGFLPEVCVEWEKEAKRAEELGVRVVNLRTGIVLSRSGGALEKMLPPFRLGIGGPLGSGNQWWPWVHLDDVTGIVEHVMKTPSIRGPVNAASPGIVRNADFTSALARALNRPAILPAPSFALRLIFGEMADALLSSERVIPTVALASGFAFQFEDIDAALRDLLK